MGEKFKDVVKLVGKKLTLPEKYIPLRSGPSKGRVAAIQPFLTQISYHMIN